MKKLCLFTLLVFSTHSIFAQSGIIWQSAIDVAPSTFGNGHPRIAIDASGNPLVVWGDIVGTDCNFSRWNGSGFTNPVTLNDSSTVIFSTSWSGPAIASKGDTVYVACKVVPEETSPILVYSSFNGGQSFNGPFPLNQPNGDYSRLPAITIDNAGQPIVAYMLYTSSFRDGLWSISRSNDYGLTFEPAILAGNWSGGVACDCCPAHVVSSDNKVVVMYRDNLLNVRDTWAGISYDNGVSFSTGLNIDQNNWNQPMCPSVGPDGVIIDDTLYAVFSSGISGSLKSYWSKTSMTNAQCNGSFPLSTTGANQNYPRIANYNNTVCFAWQEAVGVSSAAMLSMTDDIHNGIPTYNDTIASSSVLNVDVAVSANKVFVVWEDANSLTVKFRMGTYNSTASLISADKETSLTLFPNPTSERITLRSTKVNDESVKYTIRNSFGKSVVIGSCTFRNHKADINVSLDAGLYYMETIINGLPEVNKFMVK